MKASIRYGSILLGVSAILSKILGLYRDRLFLNQFESKEVVDMIFASFRIPDFFFFLLIGGTVSTLLIPRIQDASKPEKTLFFSSFFWGVFILFGALCIFGVFATPILIPLFSGGFSTEIQTSMTPLVQTLFGSVFFLSVSSVFAAFHQYKKQFLSLALAPILYTGTICGGILLLSDTYGITGVGISALVGAIIHLGINIFWYIKEKEKIVWAWKKPQSLWKDFRSDFLYRIINNSSFQINQSVDILMASFLIAGSVAAFSIGSSAGLILLSILGLPIANSIFPHLTDTKHEYEKQKKILKKAVQWILLLSVPATLIGLVFGKTLLQWAYGLEGSVLDYTYTVFFWTVLSLPFACAIPVLSRVFLANNDTKTPLKITTISLSIATIVAFVCTFWVFPSEKAITGLALGNFTANTLSAILFYLFFLNKNSNNNSSQ